MSSKMQLRPIVAAYQRIAAASLLCAVIILLAGSPLAWAKTTPAIHWATPPVVRYGAGLNGNILNAWVTGNLPGTFVYSPASGTVLGAGTQTLSVTFNPADTADYTSVSTTVQLTVLKAVLTVGAFDHKNLLYGVAIPTLQASIKDFVNGDTLSVVSGTPVVTTTAVQGSPVGQYPITPTLGTLAAANYSFTFAPGTLTINPAPLSVHALNDSPLPYGVQIPPLKYSITGFRNGETQSIVSGAPIVTTTAVMGSAPGQYPITTTIGTLSAPNYTFQLFGATLTIVKQTPHLTWPTPASIGYGTALNSAQLNATAHVPGAFAYTPAAGTVPHAGSATLSVTFTPTDTTDYAAATATVQLMVNKATPAINWPTPAQITPGTALSATQLDATSPVAGSFVYTPPAGTQPALGTDTLSVTFTPTDTADYTTVTATVQLTVAKPTPVITWPTPASIVYGTALSSTQLDATANVPGNFVYTPPAGTVPGVGKDTLSTTFTPTDTADYSSATATVQLNVNAAPGAGDFGSEPIGTSSETKTLTFSIASGTTVGSIGVLTMGTPNLDFANAAGTTCTAMTYSAAANCSVDVTFTPRFAGSRMGAVVLFSGANNTGTVVAGMLIYGVGTGPQIAFGPGTATVIALNVAGDTLCQPLGLAVDGAGDLIVAMPCQTGNSGNPHVIEVPAGGGPDISLAPAFGWIFPRGAAVDGAGDLFIGDSWLGEVVELPTGGGAPISISTRVQGPYALVVDGAGDVFVAEGASSQVVELPAGGGAPILINPTVDGSKWNNPETLALDAAGDLFITDSFNNRIVEVPAGGGAAFAIAPTVNGVGLSFPDGVAVDPAGNLFIADCYNNRLVEVPADGGAAFAIDPTVDGESFKQPKGMVFDAAGDLFISDYGNNRVVEINRSQPPAVSFAATAVGSTSSDSPKTVQVENIGTEALTFTGLTYPADFPEDTSGTDACTSSTSLTAGGECNLSIDFTPKSAATLSENVTLTDNALNVSGAKQSIPVSGTGTVAGAHRQ